MDKRGQIYILAAIIFGLVIYLLSVNVNVAKGTVFDNLFIEISNNYDKESAKFLTSLSQESLKNSDLNVKMKFNEFSGKFTSYSGTTDPSFSFIYFFDYSHKNEDKGKLIIGNHLAQPILVWVSETSQKINQKIIDGCKSEISLGVSFSQLSTQFKDKKGQVLESCSDVLDVALDVASGKTYDVNYVIGDIKYTSKVIRGIPQIVILSEENKDNERKVYTNHKFEKGENWVDGLKQYCDNPLLAPKPLLCNCNIREENNCLINDYCKFDKIDGCVNNE